MEARKQWAMNTPQFIKDDELFYRYARRHKLPISREPYQGVNIGVMKTDTADKIAFAMQRGMSTRYRVEARYIMPQDRKRCFDYVLKAIFQDS